MSRTVVRFQSRRKIQDQRPPHTAPTLLAVPAILNIARGPPEVAYIRGPQPRLVRAPFADAEDDWAAGLRQRVAHRLVRVLHVLPFGRTPVVLEVVDAPRRILTRILILISVTAGTL